MRASIELRRMMSLAHELIESGRLTESEFQEVFDRGVKDGCAIIEFADRLSTLILSKTRPPANDSGPENGDRAA